MYGRVAQSPGLLIRPELLENIRLLPTWHERLVNALHMAHAIPKKALARAQGFRPDSTIEKKQRSGAPFHVDNEVWCCKATNGRNVTTLRHPQRGPAVIEKDVGFDNCPIREVEAGKRHVSHVYRLTEIKAADSIKRALMREWGQGDQRRAWAPETAAQQYELQRIGI